MKKLNIIAATAISLLLTSCGYQIRLTETQSIGASPVKNAVFENADIKITYDFWGENGISYYSVYNKSDKPMYVDWKRSVFVYNSWKNSLWVEKTTTETFLVPTGVGKNIAYSNKLSTVTAERITFIPPKTYVSVPMTYNILKTLTQVSGEQTRDNKAKVTVTDNLKYDKEAQKVKIDKTTGSGTVKAFEKTFTADNTPAIFRNFMTYSFDEDFKNEQFVDNEFFVSKHLQMSSKNFFGKATKVKVTRKTGGKKSKDKVKIYDSPYKNGTNFYKTLMF